MVDLGLTGRSLVFIKYPIQIQSILQSHSTVSISIQIPTEYPHLLLMSVYTPPNAAHYGFSIFDERTGQSRHIKQSNFFSDKGQKL